MGVGCGKEGGICVWGRKDEEGDARERLFNDISVIYSIPLFAFLDEQELSKLTAAFCTQFYEAGDSIIEQGELLEQFFVVKSGKAALRTDQEAEQATELRPGDIFGEEALVGCWPSKATVEALEELEVWALDGQTFEELGLRHRLHFRKRPAVAESKCPSANVEPHLFEKTDQEHAFLMEALLRNRSLGPLLERTPKKDLEALIDGAYLCPVKEGDEPIEQGGPISDLFFMIAEGTFEVIAYGRKVQHLGPGESFGELGLLHRAPSAASVRAAAAGKLWALPRQRLRAVARGPLRRRLAGYAELLGKVELLRDAALEDRERLAEALVETRMAEGELVIKQGDEGAEMLALYEGEVVVDIEGHEMSRLMADPRAGRAEFFGERALVGSSRRAASVRVTSPSATVLSLSRAAYEHVLHAGKAEPQAESLAAEGEEEVEYSLESLEDLGLLGVGAFGTVTLVREPRTKQLMALKAVSKGLVVEANQEQAVLSEKKAMQVARSPFLVGLAATFSLNEQIYFLMEAATAGDLYTLYRRRCLFGSGPHARFAAACAARALESLHERHIIHRDLKPENLLLDSKGYCKLGDLGSATHTMGYAYTLCGTPEYMAPEVVAGCGHCQAADWWALGVLVFECMSGDSPFAAEEPCAVYRKVLSGMEHASFPQPQEESQAQTTWPDLTLQLCKSEPLERLTMRRGGVTNVTTHTWFASASFDWQLHASCQMEAPLVPAEAELGPQGGGFDVLEREGPPRPALEEGWGGDWAEGFEQRRGRAVG